MVKDQYHADVLKKTKLNRGIVVKRQYNNQRYQKNKLSSLKINNTYSSKKDTEYFEDKKAGSELIKKYRESGELHLMMNIKNMKLNGRSTSYYKNGAIYCNLIYKDHQLNGLCKGYYSNGQLSIEVLFEMGKAVAGAYYRKDGLKHIMTENQLNKKTKNAL